MVPFKEGVILQNVIECLAELALYISGCFNLKTRVFPKGRFCNMSRVGGKKPKPTRKQKERIHNRIQKLCPINFSLHSSDSLSHIV